MLPKEPMSLASMYRNDNQPESKESIVARRYCRFTQPACPVVADESVSECSGKCATKRCPCKANTTKCTHCYCLTPTIDSGKLYMHPFFSLWSIVKFYY